MFKNLVSQNVKQVVLREKEETVLTQIFAFLVYSLPNSTSNSMI